MRSALSRGLAVCCFAAPLFTACAGSSGVDEEMSRMRREMAVIKKDLSEAQLAVQRLEGQVTLLTVGRSTPVERAPETEVARSPQSSNPSHTVAIKNGSSKKARAKSDDRVLPVVRLGNKAEPAASGEQDWDDEGAIDDGSPPLVIKLGPDESAHDERDRITVDRDVLKKPVPVATKSVQEPARASTSEATSKDMEAEYQAALQKLRGDNKPAEALALFKEFRAKNPRSNLADNATYWSGECLFAEGSHQKAIDEFELLVRDYPRSSKRADAMFRIGEAHVALANSAKARASFQLTIDNYPKTDAAIRARAALAKLSNGSGDGGN